MNDVTEYTDKKKYLSCPVLGTTLNINKGRFNSSGVIFYHEFWELRELYIYIYMYWAAENIGLYVNAHKTEYMCYNQTGDISTLEGTPLKLVDKFTYLGSSVESTEKDIETRLTKA